MQNRFGPRLHFYYDFAKVGSRMTSGLSFLMPKFSRISLKKKLAFPPIDLYLNFEIPSLKNQGQ